MEEIEAVISQMETENAKRAASDPLIKASLKVVETFLRTHKVMCYGGTAINNLLPPKDQFYNFELEVPDYDFFSQTPQEHSMMLANQLADLGVLNVEVKPGIHLGTFKVFADFEGVADITFLEPAIFEKLWQQEIIKNGIHYVTPNFLRMSMYLELSRHRGDVSRWKKVYTRLQLLNKHYPLVCPGNIDDPPVVQKEVRKKIETLLRNEPVVLLGISASQVHRKKPNWYVPVDILADADTIDKLTTNKKTRQNKGSEVLPPTTDLLDEDGKPIIRFYETTACHSFHAMADGTRVASIPTILQLFFAYIYTGASDDDIIRILCIAQQLMDMANHKPKRRYALLTPTDCIGKQETLLDMRKNKSKLYDELSYSKTSAEFLRYFFAYNPRDTPTRRKMLREALKRTRRARLRD